jgi:hypothetical protein
MISHVDDVYMAVRLTGEDLDRIPAVHLGLLENKQTTGPF